jgi:hypothetical protein
VPGGQPAQRVARIPPLLAPYTGPGSLAGPPNCSIAWATYRRYRNDW